jgi:hypothetical membrane protein
VIVPSNLRRARILAVVSAAYALGFYVVGGLLKPGYSHSANFLSELNATGTPWATELGLLGFLPLGLLLGAFLVVAYPLGQFSSQSAAHASSPAHAGFLLLWSQPIAFIGAAAAPCDAGCPFDGTITQHIHNLIGFVTYMAAGLGFFLLSFHATLTTPGRWFLRLASLAWIVLFFLMLTPDLAAVRGLLQRVAEAILWAVVLLVAWRLAPTRAVGGG